MSKFELLKPVLFLSYFVLRSYDDAGNVNVAPNVQRGMRCSDKLKRGFHDTNLSAGA